MASMRILLMSNDLEHCLMGVFDICVSSVKCLFKFFLPLKKLDCVLDIEFESSLCVLDTSPYVNNLQTSQSVPCRFILLMSFKEQKFSF